MSPGAILARAARRPRLALAAGLGALLLAGAAAAGGGAGAGALRASLVLLALGVLAALARRRPGPAGPSALGVEARLPLGRDSGVALVRADGRRFLLGYGPAGAALAVELSRAEERP